MRAVRLILAACLSALYAGQPAFADASTRNWSGCYAGLHAGALWGMVDHKVTGFPVDPSYQRDVSYRGATAGAHGGCNYQSGSLVFGIEGDFSWAPIDESAVAYVNEDTERRQLWRDRLDWLATLRGRIGYTRGPWHAFATGGFAFSDLKLGFEAYQSGALEAAFVKQSTRGWVAGGGVEYMLHPQWVARFEYLYHRFDNRLLLIDGGNSFFRADDPHFHVIRAGITRRFGM